MKIKVFDYSYTVMVKFDKSMAMRQFGKDVWTLTQVDLEDI